MKISFTVNIVEVYDEGHREPTEEDYNRFLELFKKDMEDVAHEICSDLEYCLYYEMEDIESDG